MRKIGIVTFHRAVNIGAMLQAFALQKALETEFVSEIVDYRCSCIEYGYGYKITPHNYFKNILKSILYPKRMLLAKKRLNNYANFESRYLVKSPQFYDEKSLKQANRHYDAFVSGSDQIWNLKLTDNDWNYYLEFAELNKRYSYAASFGDINYDSKDALKAKKMLSEYKSLLLREKSGKSVLDVLEINNDNVKVVCDPVFLLSKEDWIEALNLTYSKHEKYILLYIVADYTYAIEYARKLSQKLGCQIKYINLYGRLTDCPCDMQNCNTVGPKEFLNLLLNAQCVVTTSFHGMALSLVFNKQFFYELNHINIGRNNRLTDIAEVCDVCEREIRSSDLIEGQINYEIVNKKITNYVAESKETLFKSLEKSDL